VQVVPLPGLGEASLQGYKILEVSDGFALGKLHLTNLQTLEFTDVYELTVSILQNRQILNLAKLILRNCAPKLGQFHGQSVITMLSQYCPKLEYFELGLSYFYDIHETEMVGGGAEYSWGNMRTLKIDLEVLVNLDNRHALLGLHKILPLKLSALYITRIDADEFLNIMQPYLSPSCDNPSNFNHIFQLAALTSIKEMFTTVGFIHRVNDAYRQLKTVLLLITTNLRTMTGLSLQVYKPAQGDETNPTLLVDSRGYHND
jgi:hypothetical protein